MVCFHIIAMIQQNMTLTFILKSDYDLMLINYELDILGNLFL